MVIALSSLDKSFRDNFLKNKLELQAKGYPEDESKKFVEYYYLKLKHQILKSVEPNSILINVPSGSGINPLTKHFSNFIIEELSKIDFIYSGDFFTQTATLPAKNKLSFTKRLNDPIFFNLYDYQKFEKLKKINQNRTYYVIEDWFSTGESSVNFMRELQKNGLEVKNIIALISNTKYLTNAYDLIPLVAKCIPFSKSSHNELIKAVIANFEGYSKNKMTRFLHEFSSGTRKHNLVRSLFEMKDKYLEQGLITEKSLEKSYKNFVKLSINQSISL